MNKRVLLMILDGYGFSEKHEHNAIFLAQKPNLDHLMQTCPHSLVETSGTSVGLPKGVMGNSEVGHLNIGSGRIIKQELSKIGDFAREKGFETLLFVKNLFDEKKGALHLLGLLSDGSVHSHEEHLFALLEAAARAKCERPIFIHVITDGRDTPPKSALKYVANLEAAIKKTGMGRIATVSGRYYIMDRDKRWDRTELAYRALTSARLTTQGAKVSGTFAHFPNANAAVQDAYAHGENDEFIKPRLIVGGEPIQHDDSLLFFNFRADRMRQICAVFAIDGFNEFSTPVKIKAENVVTFTQYDETFPFKVLFGRTKIKNILGELVSSHGEKQLRIAETEKYAHVTYFFNGGEEAVFKGEDRVLIPSPKDVATYDLKPEMSAHKLTDELLEKMQSDKYKLIVLNFANSDMLGHTGVEPAAIKAIEVLDECIGRIIEVCKKQNYDLLITADHGNSECMVDPVTGAPHTSHTTNPVPLIWMNSDTSLAQKTHKNLANGILADIAPTILELFGWPKPSDMTGKSLLSWK
jgi:2,3-bisphosphoglycerate-independent phosphoglycerate mutase